MRLLTATSLCGLLCFVTTSAFAAPTAVQDPKAGQGSSAAPAGPATAPPAAAPSTGAAASDNVEKARIHYERGLVLFNEENYDAALFEFERAYELAPSYKILYNMGRIQRQQNNYSAAMRSYARYLREGGANIPADRRAEVEKELSVLKPRVAELVVKVNVDGANVYADDIPVCAATIESSCVGISPLREPIVVNGGRHKVTATKKGYLTATALVSVVGSDTAEVKLDLVSTEQKPIPKQNPWVVPTIVGWGATGLALIGASITGALAMGAQNDQEALLKRFNTDPAASKRELGEARDKTQTLSGVSDALFITTAVFAGASAYFTIRMIGFNGKEAEPKPATAKSLDFRISPMGVGAVGTF
jgi:hypothetical protein